MENNERYRFERLISKVSKLKVTRPKAGSELVDSHLIVHKLGIHHLKHDGVYNMKSHHGSVPMRSKGTRISINKSVIARPTILNW
jgi:hypothetical protein